MGLATATNNKEYATEFIVSSEDVKIGMKIDGEYLKRLAPSYCLQIEQAGCGSARICSSLGRLHSRSLSSRMKSMTIAGLNTASEDCVVFGASDELVESIVNRRVLQQRKRRVGFLRQPECVD